MVRELRSSVKYRTSEARDLDLVEGSSSNKDTNPDKKLKRSNEAMEIKGEVNPCSGKKLKRQRRVIHDPTGQPVNTKKEICGLAPIVRCPQNGKMSESCIQKDGTDQDMHLGEGCKPVLPDKVDIPVPPEAKEKKGPLKASCRMVVQPARMIISGQQKLEGEIKEIPHCQHTTDSEEANGSTRSNTIKRQRRVTHDQTGLPVKTEIASSRELEKTGLTVKTEIASSRELEKEIRELAPIVRCPQNGKTSESCIQKDGTDQDMHLGILPSQQCSDEHVFTKQQINDSEEADGSQKNEIVVTEQQVIDSEEATESPSSDISKRISHVEMIYSKRMEMLLASQSKKSLQFKETRNRIVDELTEKLGKEHLNASVLVRKMHPGYGARSIELKNVDKEFLKKQQLIKTHLNMEQVKLDSIHKADRKKERKLKSHWMHEAKSGREVDVYSILPLFLHSCFNLDDLKNPSEPLLLNSSNTANSVLPHALQIELPIAKDSFSELVQSNESKDGIALVLQLQRPQPTNAPSEPRSGRHVSENSLLCQQVKEEKHVQVLKFDEELARNCRVDQAQPVKCHKKLKVCINTDFLDIAQKKKAVGTSFNRATGSLGSCQDKLQLKVGGELTPCLNVKRERNVDQTELPARTEDSSHVKVKQEKSLGTSEQFGVQTTSHWRVPVAALGLRGGSPIDVICIPKDPPEDVICISDDDK